jgi:hypothetical protein
MAKSNPLAVDRPLTKDEYEAYRHAGLWTVLDYERMNEAFCAAMQRAGYVKANPVTKE